MHRLIRPLLAGFAVLKIPFATAFFLRLLRGIARNSKLSDLIAHLTWFPLNEKLVADGLLAKIVARPEEMVMSTVEMTVLKNHTWDEYVFPACLFLYFYSEIVLTVVKSSLTSVVPKTQFTYRVVYSPFNETTPNPTDVP